MQHMAYCFHGNHTGSNLGDLAHPVTSAVAPLASSPLLFFQLFWTVWWDSASGSLSQSPVSVHALGKWCLAELCV